MDHPRTEIASINKLLPDFTNLEMGKNITFHIVCLKILYSKY